MEAKSQSHQNGSVANSISNVRADHSSSHFMLASRRHSTASPARIPRKMNSGGARQICGISLSLILINLAAIMERADENLLPSVYREVSEAFNAGPSDLGYLTFIRNFVQGLASPMAGILVTVHDRPTVLALGTFCWAVSTAAVGVSQRFLQVAFWRAMNGFGLAIVIPSLSSFIADSYAEEARGTGFGVVNVIGSIGGIGGGVAATIMAGRSFFGFPGWRFAFLLMASLSIFIGCLVFLFVSDPRSAIKAPPRGEVKSTGSRSRSRSRPRSGAKQVWDESMMAMKTVVRIKTFQFIVLQGLVGSLPWTAMVFFTMWFELIGFDHTSAAALLSFFAVGCAVGSLIGGLIADRMAKAYPNSGRVLCAQFSAFMGIPYAYVLLRAIPQTVASYSAYAWTLLTMGLFISWSGTAANAPMFAEVVPARHRTMIYAFDRAFEVSFSSFAAPLVGILSENVFGYDGKNIGTDAGSAREALALSKGLLAMMALPFALCCLLYTPLHFYFKMDRESSRTFDDDVAII